LGEMKQIKESFFTYFRQDCLVFPDVEQTLKTLSAGGIKIGTLSDVAYGMDNKYALEDIAPIIKYIDYPFTSNDAGYRKPCTKGLEILSEKMQTYISDIVFVGDEEKDMVCAKNAGAYAVLINRDDDIKDYGQDKEIHTLTEILQLFGLK
ncbi:MAG: HAD family hydrolase, partial [Lachnospiraceae bacterium]|nr:HAD family hydrolase [Lachnospiraceae bacterium]